MKNTASVISAIRFRCWSRKAYAAFASIGRCVTIGCLRKEVADSSLSKQKAMGSTGRAVCSIAHVWEGITEEKEDNYGIPPEKGAFLFCRIVERIMLPSFFPVISGIHPYNKKGQEIFSLKRTKNYIDTDYRNLYNLLASHYNPTIRVLFYK